MNQNILEIIKNRRTVRKFNDSPISKETIIKILEAATCEFSNVSIGTFSGLLATYAAQEKATAVLRGIRAFSDFEYELQMALMNHKLEPQVETVFLMPAESYIYVTSRLVKEIAEHGGSVKDLVPAFVEEKLRQKIH